MPKGIICKKKGKFPMPKGIVFKNFHTKSPHWQSPCAIRE
jgi:hypothetical protein